jgi:anti-sigma factor RsiW
VSPTLSPKKRREERCRETHSRLSDYIDGDLEADERRRVERHLRWCPRCRRVLASLTRTVSGLRRLGQRERGLSVPDPTRGRRG